MVAPSGPAWVAVEAGDLGCCRTTSSGPSIPEARGQRSTTSVEARDAGRGPSWGLTEGSVEAMAVAAGVGNISWSSSIIGVRECGERGDGMFSNNSGSKTGSARLSMGELDEGGSRGRDELDGGGGGTAELGGEREVDRLREGGTGAVSTGGSATFALLSATTGLSAGGGMDEGSGSPVTAGGGGGNDRAAVSGHTSTPVLTSPTEGTHPAGRTGGSTASPGREAGRVEDGGTFGQLAWGSGSGGSTRLDSSQRLSRVRQEGLAFICC